VHFIHGARGCTGTEADTATREHIRRVNGHSSADRSLLSFRKHTHQLARAKAVGQSVHDPLRVAAASPALD